MSEALLAQAQAALDRALAARPHSDGEALTEAAKAVAAYRDALRQRLRGGDPDPLGRRRLAETNALISLLLAVHYPLDGVPWALLEQAKMQLERLESG